MSCTCGIIFTSDWATPIDARGCRRPDHHDGPHEFVDENGIVWQWETDWGCECDWCSQGLGDWCFTFWKARDQTKINPAP